MEGRAFRLISDKEKPLPPKYVRMPGRPKKERKRQDGEKKKPTRGKLSKKGTVIRCRVCKGIGHNRTTCSRKTGFGDQSGGASQPARGSGGASQPTSAGASHSHRASGGAT
jgi:alpha-galactosidase